jgi:hypothetical protein
MRYKVTGGADGISGIAMGGKRYEAGDTIEMSGEKAQWLVDKGLLEPVSGKPARGKKAADDTPAKKEEDAPEPWAFDDDSGDDL